MAKFTFKAVRNSFNPYRGQTYFSINLDNPKKILFGVRKHNWTGDKFDRARLASNNVFQTIDKAKSTRDQMTRELKTAQLL